MGNKKGQAFHGTWRLLSVETRNDKGDLVRRGKRKGYLIYSPDGYMSVCLMKEGRTLFKSGDIRGGTAEEKIEAIEGYISYAGRYTVHDNTVVHQIEVSLFPNWLGVNQKRFFRFDGKQLVLSTPLMLVGGRQLRTNLVWERV